MLLPRAFRRQQPDRQVSDLRMEAAIPAEMFARHADSFFPAVKRVKGLEVREHDTTDLIERRPGRGVSSESCAQFPEDPGPALGGATDHHAVGSAKFERLQGLG